ncbi:hypothetical protein WG70_31725 [Burkholderia oklahomensis EO147]|nr:hypothetical protein WG70_31725 [Burkholderia oklahomensis EO147]KUY55592.1 hypothetical protein WG70_12250 [Burkholderia oklahomensis EO147]
MPELKLLNAGFGRRQFFGHSAAQFLNRLANFLSHLVVCSIGVLLALDTIASQLFLGLRGSEQIGGQFRAAHVVEDLLIFLQPFFGVNFLVAQSAVQAFVAMILKDRILDRCFNASLFGCCGQMLVVGRKLIANC